MPYLFTLFFSDRTLTSEDSSELHSLILLLSSVVVLALEVLLGFDLIVATPVFLFICLGLH